MKPETSLKIVVVVVLAPAVVAAQLTGAQATRSVTGGRVHEINAHKPLPSRPTLARPTPAASIIFVRPRQRVERDGDLWIASASGQNERRLSTDGRFRGLSADGRRVACLGNDGICLLRPPDWRPKQVMTPRLPSVRDGPGQSRSKAWLSDGACWRPGTRQLFFGAGQGDAGDGGLWLADLDRRAVRRVLPPIDADFPLNDEILPSPRGTRVAAGGYGDTLLWLRVFDFRTGRQIRQPGRQGILGGASFAWLDEDNLLVAGSPGGDWEERGHWHSSKGGIRRLSLRTGRLTPWLYSTHTSVDQLLRSPKGDRLAAVVDLPAKPHPAGDYLVLVDPRTKSQRILSTPGPPTLLGFSADGTHLLITAGTDPNDERQGDLYVLDLQVGGRRLIARDVIEAVWAEAPPANRRAPRAALASPSSSRRRTAR